jgi:hypothetical protein
MLEYDKKREIVPIEPRDRGSGRFRLNFILTLSFRSFYNSSNLMDRRERYFDSRLEDYGLFVMKPQTPPELIIFELC